MDILRFATPSSSLQAFIEYGILRGIGGVSLFDFLLQTNNLLRGKLTKRERTKIIFEQVWGEKPRAYPSNDAWMLLILIEYLSYRGCPNSVGPACGRNIM